MLIFIVQLVKSFITISVPSIVIIEYKWNPLIKTQNFQEKCKYKVLWTKTKWKEMYLIQPIQEEISTLILSEWVTLPGNIKKYRFFIKMFIIIIIFQKNYEVSPNYLYYTYCSALGLGLNGSQDLEVLKIIQIFLKKDINILNNIINNKRIAWIM